MDDGSAPPEIGMSIVRGCLVVPIQMDLEDEAVLAIQADILKRVGATGVRGVVIDLSAASVVDTFAFEILARTARMASLLGARTILSGIQPGVASALVDLGVETDGLLTARTLEDAFRQLEPVVLPPAEAAGGGEEGGGDPGSESSAGAEPEGVEQAEAGQDGGARGP